MSDRSRSPNYPSIALPQAIDIVGKIFKSERTHSVERDVAAQAAGYASLSGRSAKVLADLSQYGLLERTGKSGVRVSARAVEILHPDSDASHTAALEEAAYEPELFQRIKARFPDGLPSEAALRSYFLKEGFTDNAIQPAIRGYLDTCRFIEDKIASGGRGQGVASGENIVANQQDVEATPMSATRHAVHTAQAPVPAAVSGIHAAMTQDAMTLDWPNKRAVISRVITTRQEANDVIAFLNAVTQFLPVGDKEPDRATNDEEPANDENEDRGIFS